MTEIDPRLARCAEALYRRVFSAFLAKVFHELHGSSDAFVPNWHVEAMCHVLEELQKGRVLRQVITVPPRHLKSITTAVAWPAFLLGHDPSTKIIVASYSLDLARKHSEDFRRVVESGWYRALFPATRIISARQDEIRTHAGGGRKAVSIGGAVTGFGANYLIVDDLLKASDANSEAELLRAQTYLEGSLLSRFDDPRTGRVVVIQQRLHEDDPAGYLLAKGTYAHLNLPAIAETDEEVPLGRGRIHRRGKGEALCPQRLDLGDLERLRKEMGSVAFNLQYQQNPIAPEGSALRWEWFGIHESNQGRGWYQLIVQSWDTGMSADPRSDYSVCTTWGFREGVWYLLDLFRDRLDYPDLKRKTLSLGAEWDADVVLIESAGTGIPLLQECHNEVRRRYRRIDPIDDKEVRFNAACAPVQAGQVSLPREAPWLAEFRRELLGFPRAKFDDQVDSFSQFLNWTTGRGPSRKLSRGPSGRRQSMNRRQSMRRS